MSFVSARRVVMTGFSMLLFAAAFGQNLFASSVVVGTCKSLVKFSTIQAAIDAVPSGSTVNICAGIYHEQLMITKTITLTGVVSGTNDAVVILPPTPGGLVANATSLSSGNPIAAHIAVLGAPIVTMSNIIVDSIGNGISGCAPDLVGIFYQNSSGTMTHVVTRNQWLGASEGDPNLSGCQSGEGIFVQSGNGLTSQVSVVNSSVHDYQKNGITGNEAGTTLTVSGTDVVGQGATNGAAENGIQIGFGAAGSIMSSLVIDDVWAPDTSTDTGDAAAGILLFDAESGGATVKGNTVGNTQFGIAIVNDTAGQGNSASVTANKVFGTRLFDAIDVCTSTNVVQTNNIVNSTESAIHLDASCGTGNGNVVNENTIVDACAGVLVDAGALSNAITPNTFFATGTTSGSSCTPTPAPAAAGAMRKVGGSGRLVSRYKPIRP
jgi:hypothetical protein